MKQVPFYSQIVNWNGENSGFPSQVEIQNWQDKCCGIACLRMILDDFGCLGDLTYWEILQLGLHHQAHCDKGWIHQGLLNMGQVLGIEGQTHRQASIEHIINAINKGSLCIVSVTRGFLGGKDDGAGNQLPRGGHLVVAYDTVKDNGTVTRIICNYPSSYPELNKAAWAVEIEKWRDSFSGSFIEFYPKST
jgi:hypothetical protein